jgi:hypothetical protein
VTWRRHREGVEPLPFLQRRQTKPFFVGALVVSVLFDVVPPLFVFVGQTSFIGVLAGVARTVAPGSPGPLGWTSRRVVFRLEQQQDVFRKKSHQVLHHDTLRESWKALPLTLVEFRPLSRCLVETSNCLRQLLLRRYLGVRRVPFILLQEFD